MKKTLLYIAVPALTLAVCMIYLLILGEQDAREVRESVLRFHVVAKSDSPEDQGLKIKVRDGIFEVLRPLFSDCETREEAMEVADANRMALQAEAERILRAEGCEEPVTLELGTRFFPTKSYGALSFPAGNYQAVSIRIGEAEGRNFWCVLYPALCIAPAVADGKAEQELAAVIGQEGTDFLKKSTQKQEIKFFLVEWFEKFSKKFKTKI